LPLFSKLALLYCLLALQESHHRQCNSNHKANRYCSEHHSLALRGGLTTGEDVLGMKRRWFRFFLSAF
jgi:hypothetical protein